MDTTAVAATTLVAVFILMGGLWAYTRHPNYFGVCGVLPARERRRAVVPASGVSARAAAQMRVDSLHPHY